jgi:hypothetical protein
MNFRKRLEELGAAGDMGAPELTVRSFERQFGLQLPASYRAFLRECGGARVRIVVSMLEPSPLGSEASIHEFFGLTGAIDIRGATEMSDGAPVAIPIADNMMGFWTYLICEGPLAGGVYHHDRELRSSWSDQEFRENFVNLAFEIERYLVLRRTKRLRTKPAALAHFYKLADSFDEFLGACRLETNSDER